MSLLYFSGTGNTAWVAQRLVEQFCALGDRMIDYLRQDEAPHAAAIGDRFGRFVLDYLL